MAFYYLELLRVDAEGEEREGQLFDDFASLKETLAQEEAKRFVITELFKTTVL